MHAIVLSLQITKLFLVRQALSKVEFEPNSVVATIQNAVLNLLDRINDERKNIDREIEALIRALRDLEKHAKAAAITIELKDKTITTERQRVADAKTQLRDAIELARKTGREFAELQRECFELRKTLEAEQSARAALTQNEQATADRTALEKQVREANAQDLLAELGGFIDLLRGESKTSPQKTTRSMADYQVELTRLETWLHELDNFLADIADSKSQLETQKRRHESQVESGVEESRQDVIRVIAEIERISAEEARWIQIRDNVSRKREQIRKYISAMKLIESGLPDDIIGISLPEIPESADEIPTIESAAEPTETRFVNNQETSALVYIAINHGMTPFSVILLTALDVLVNSANRKNRFSLAKIFDHLEKVAPDKVAQWSREDSRSASATQGWTGHAIWTEWAEEPSGKYPVYRRKPKQKLPWNITDILSAKEIELLQRSS